MMQKETEIQPTCPKHGKKAKSPNFWKSSSMFKPPFKGAPALPENKERRRIETHRLEFEQKRTETTRIVQQRIL